MKKRKFNRITPKMLYKRWEEYDITQKELIFLIEERILTLQNQNGKIYERPSEITRFIYGSRDSILDTVFIDLSEIEESEEEILRGLRPQKFQSEPKDIEDSTKPEPEIAEEVAVDIKDKEIAEGREFKRTAEFDQAVLELMEAEPEISKNELIKRKKHLYPGYVTDGAIRKHLTKFQKKHGLFKIEQPGVKKRT